MKQTLLLFLSMILVSAGLQAQIETVGIIGTATEGGWDFDTDMDQDPENPDIWTLNVLLMDGEAKFRANDDWAINWGNSDFPIGTGLQEGPNIPVTGGLHDVTFNSATGEYYFSVVSDIGIIGSAAPFGWDADVNMYQTAEDPDQYFLTLDLVIGAVKFRQDDDWEFNWGNTDFPTGIGIQNGPDIPIEKAGKYYIEFNKATGAYSFEEIVSFHTVGLIGDATAGGWDEPTPMHQDAGNPSRWTLSTPLNAGGLQFSGNEGEVIWGASDFPSGTAVVDGDIIPVHEGNWLVEFNTATGAYQFSFIQIFDRVGIIGDATPGGWEEDTPMDRDANDSSEWSLRIILFDGEAKFRANNDWAINWGSGDFPSGVGTQDGANIPITAGEYVVTFNSITGVYNFRELMVFSSVGLIGTGSPFQNWDDDVFMTRDPDDDNIWTLASVDLVDGECKFRAEADWAVNWGATDWPTGVGTQDGPNIPITGGTYGVTLNSATGEYAFGDPISSTQDLLKPSAISVFPNPAVSVLNIDLREVEMHGNVTLRVMDISGKLVHTEVQQADTMLRLNIAGLQAGHYTLQISSDRYIIGKKFVVAR